VCSGGLPAVAAGGHPAQVGAVQQLRAERQHAPEVALVAVGQRRGQPVGPLHVQRELAGALGGVQQRGRHVQAEPAGVGDPAEQRAQHDQVVVGAALALDAVGPDVGGRVGGEQVQRGPGAGGVVERQRDQQQRVDLQVRWLRSAVRCSARCAASR
jgi:hypothetical protein